MKFFNQKGITVIEMVMALMVVGLIGGIIFTFLADQLVAQHKASGRADLQQQARQTLIVLARDIKHSAHADLENRWEDENSPGAPGDLYSWESNSNTLILAQPVRNVEGDILFEDSLGYISHKDNHIYYLDDTTLKKRTLAADVAGNRETTTCPTANASCNQDAILAKDVSALNFTYKDGNNEIAASPDDARSIVLDITITKDIFGEIVDGSYSLQVVFRNE
ncbi:MAG: hypothetical protein WDZ81_00870 [Candidatus Saccharimonadales bacterium]